MTEKSKQLLKTHEILNKLIKNAKQDLKKITAKKQKRVKFHSLYRRKSLPINCGLPWFQNFSNKVAFLAKSRVLRCNWHLEFQRWRRISGEIYYICV